MKAFVIKFDNDYYWCGYNNSDKQLRKAVLYKSIKMAEETAKDCMDRIEYIRPYVNKIKSYKIIEVTIAEGDLEQENAKLNSELEGKVDYWEWQNNMAKTKHIEILEKDIEIYKKALELACDFAGLDIDEWSKGFIEEAKRRV